ncbi:MAG: hypothetical protein ACK5A0_01195 [Polaromonas sp.]|jgi:hypothetical protein
MPTGRQTTTNDGISAGLDTALSLGMQRLKLAVPQILPLQGRLVPVAELYTAVGQNN